jgi:hypothetical protein
LVGLTDRKRKTREDTDPIQTGIGSTASTAERKQHSNRSSSAPGPLGSQRR